jgi:hypothetical protein
MGLSLWPRQLAASLDVSAPSGMAVDNKTGLVRRFSFSEWWHNPGVDSALSVQQLSVASPLNRLR